MVLPNCVWLSPLRQQHNEERGVFQLRESQFGIFFLPPGNSWVPHFSSGRRKVISSGEMSEKRAAVFWGDPRAIGRVYNIGGSSFTLRQYIEMIFHLTGKRVSLISGEREWTERNGLDVGGTPYFFPGDLVLNTSKIRKEMEFEPVYLPKFPVLSSVCLSF